MIVHRVIQRLYRPNKYDVPRLPINLVEIKISVDRDLAREDEKKPCHKYQSRIANKSSNIDWR